MPNIIDILARAQSLMNETALNSITPPRAGGIMYDTLLVLNQMQLEGASLLISKVYASVSAMEADTTPTSDLTGRALKPGQLVVIVTSDPSSSDMASEYRYNGPGSWTYVGKVGGLPLDTVPTQNSTKGIASGGVYAALSAMKAEGYKYMGIATPRSGGTSPGTPNQPVFYIAGPGSYPNFGSITVASSYLGFIKYSSGSWSVESVAVGKDYDAQISQLKHKLYGEGDVVLNLSSYTEEVGTISGAKFYDTGGNYPNWRYILIPVIVYRGRTMRIVPHSSSDSTTYAFLTDDVLVHNTDVNFATGYTQPASSAVTFDVVVPNDANYLFLRAENVSTSKVYLPQSLTILAITGDIDKKVDKVVGKGLSKNDYTDADKEKVASIPNTFVSPSDLDNYVPKAQGVENAGLLLKVGADGNVTLGTGGGTQPDVSDCVQKKVSRTLHLGADILSGTTGAGTGWTESAGAYTHESGAETTLEFPLNTDSGDAYVAILSSNIAGNKEESLLVSIGDGVPCDTYNGTTGPFYVGMVSDGGYLKITADSTYTGTISGVELRKIVSEEDADISVTLNTDNNKHYENVDAGTTIANITGWWNVAIGATDAMKSNQNGSRNIAIGQRSMLAMEGGTRNIGIGTFALHRLVYGARNIAIGADSAWYITNGYDNVAIGKAAFGEIRGTTPLNNIAIGTSALSQNTNENPENNVAIGTNALAGGSNSTAKTHCVAIGVSAGRSNNTKCVAVGENAGFYVTGQGNVAVGYDAMNYYNVDGQNNICIGHLARLYPPSRPATINNAIAIGYNAKATKSNQVVIGNASHTEFVLGDKKIVFNTDNTISWEAIS